MGIGPRRSSRPRTTRMDSESQERGSRASSAGKGGRERARGRAEGVALGGPWVGGRQWLGGVGRGGIEWTRRGPGSQGKTLVRIRASSESSSPPPPGPSPADPSPRASCRRRRRPAWAMAARCRAARSRASAQDRGGRPPALARAARPRRAVNPRGNPVRKRMGRKRHRLGSTRIEGRVGSGARDWTG
jgi:hypothetical protein